MKVLMILVTILIGFLYFELFLCKIYRRNIGCLIHVNGVRGKSTVARMLDAALKEHKYRTIVKTTGSEPAYIDISGEVISIKRKSSANIREQIKILKLASKKKCDFYIVECMAVNPLLQRYSELILNADITIITNVKMDHLGVLGFNKEQVGKSLLMSRPKNGILVTDDYYGIEGSLGKDHRVSKSFYSDNSAFSKNSNMVLTICEILGLDLDKSKCGIDKYDLDIGHKQYYEVSGGVFINGFSANDYESTNEILDKYSNYMGLNFSILYNNRSDRNYRMILMIDLIIKYNPKILYISGDSILYVKRKIRKAGYNGLIKIVNTSKEIEFSNFITVGIGNIKGGPIEILKEIECL